MLKLTADALADFLLIETLHMSRGRSEALQKFYAAFDSVTQNLNVSLETFHPAPRPFPKLKILGLRWKLIHRYWFGMTYENPPVIEAIFDSQSDIPSLAQRFM